jgi:hypothetical protein
VQKECVQSLKEILSFSVFSIFAFVEIEEKSNEKKKIKLPNSSISEFNPMSKTKPFENITHGTNVGDVSGMS